MILAVGNFPKSLLVNHFVTVRRNNNWFLEELDPDNEAEDRSMNQKNLQIEPLVYKYLREDDYRWRFRPVNKMPKLV